MQKGKLVISAAKSLKSFQLGDPRIATFLHGTWHAGRVGLFVSAMRSARNTPMQRIRLLAGAEGIDYLSLAGNILPWLENAGLCRLRKNNDGEIIAVDSLVLTYNQLLGVVSDFYEALQPAPEDRGCLLALHMVTAIPMPESQVLDKLALEFDEQSAVTALALAKSYRIVDEKKGFGLQESILYSSKVWSHSIARASKALRPLDNTAREVILHLVERVRQHQGIPEGLIRREARNAGAEHLFELTMGIGLLDKTEISMADGTKRSFLTSPHFYADLAEEFGEDMCDRVKIFLDSIRNGQHFGAFGTGRILYPDILLKRLLNNGIIGPATAIRTDYILSEKAGIVRVRPYGSTSRGYMELVQKDTVEKVLEIVVSGSTDPGSRQMKLSNIQEGYQFQSIEQSRAEMGKLPTEIAEAENAIILQLRES
jgi:hypothetical protein